ncbi:MAG: hypothetical protein ABSA47_14075 [Verrucomicrobiota bacterium]
MFTLGELWVSRAKKTPVIELTNGTLVISNTGVLLNFDVAVSNNNTLAKLPGGSADSLTGSISDKTGLLTVTFGNSNKNKTTGYGAVLQGQTNGGGYFLTSTNAGAISLGP